MKVTVTWKEVKVNFVLEQGMNAQKESKSMLLLFL